MEISNKSMYWDQLFIKNIGRIKFTVSKFANNTGLSNAADMP